MASISKQPHSESPKTISKKLYGIQALRGIAALSVVFHHVLEESSPLLRNSPVPDAIVLSGAAGVDVFFVISGFIMLSTTVSRFGQPRAGLRFFSRRLTRIAPLYWLCTLAILAAYSSGVLYRHLSVSAASLIGSLLFVDSGHLILGVGWTLNYEMWFYLVFACFLFVRSVRVAVCLIIATLFVGLLLGALSPAGAVPGFFANPISIEFCYGLAIAVIYLLAKRVTNAIRWTALAAGLAGIALASIYAPHTTTAGLEFNWRFLAWGIPAALIVFSLIECQRPKTAAGRFLQALGDSSYSLYLTHSILMTIFAHIIRTGDLDRVNPYLVVAMVVTASVSVGFAAYHFLEKRIEAFAKGATPGPISTLPAEIRAPVYPFSSLREISAAPQAQAPQAKCAQSGD